MHETTTIDITKTVGQHFPFLGRKGRATWNIQEGKVTVAGSARGQIGNWRGWYRKDDGHTLFYAVWGSLLKAGLEHPEVKLPWKIEVFSPGSRAFSTKYEMGWGRRKVHVCDSYKPLVAEKKEEEKKCKKLRARRSTTII